jgi:hypothetical protein
MKWKGAFVHCGGRLYRPEYTDGNQKLTGSLVIGKTRAFEITKEMTDKLNKAEGK